MTKCQFYIIFYFIAKNDYNYLGLGLSSSGLHSGS